MDELAKAIGYARASSIQRYENENDFIKEFIQMDLAAKLVGPLAGRGTPPIVDDEVWALSNPEARMRLMQGAKRSLISSYDPDEDSQDGGAYSREHWKPQTAGAIPELDVKLGAGNGTIGDIINLPVGDNNVSGHRVLREWVIPHEYLKELNVSPRHSTIMEVIGDSMQPTYLPGDKVLIDLSQDVMNTDTVYAISYDDEPPQIKRLQKIPFSDPKQVKIISDNPILETFTVELDRLTIIGRICGHMARK
ncbi:hypothetical protein MP213Fo_04470 [Pseudochrobactrum sp. MP213Fo]